MSEIKVNKISPRTNCGTVQLGDSGDTITIPAGATITNNGTAAGFGATGAASWDTTVKTTGFTAVSGVGYFVDTTAGAISVNLPAGVAGAVVAIKDYANTFDTNDVTLVQNGSDKIGGSTDNSILSTEGIAVTLVFIDSTQGWLVTDSGLQSEVPGTQYVTATGGTITCSGDYRIHTFTGPGTFTVTCAGNGAGSNTVDYLAIAGGGGGGFSRGGGAGSGGYRESDGTASGCYTVSPRGACVSALPVSVQAYPITVGAGGAAGSPSPQRGCNGANSVFSTIISAGGGGGGGTSLPACNALGRAGGSGGGGGISNCVSGLAGSGNTPPVSPAQGFDGGRANATPTPIGPTSRNAGGGGGAIAVGVSGGGCNAGNGGPGGTSSINGTPTARAGGGAGGTQTRPSQPGGIGGGGSGGTGCGNVGGNGTTNTGGGGGGGSDNANGGAGGSGIVIIRYKFQN